MLEQRQEGALQPCGQTRSRHGRRIHRQVVEIADEELVAERELGRNSRRTRSKFGYCGTVGDNQAEIREQGAQIDGPLNPSYSLLLHSTFLRITTVSRYALQEKGLGHDTPAELKPTISAMPPPSTSASLRG
jgi:hypothetical protein